MKLHGYQRDLVTRFEKSEKRALCVVLPTGTGKTHVAAAIIRRHVKNGGRVIFVAHRTELIEQARRRVIDAGVRDVGVIKAGVEPTPDARVQVASVATLVRRGVVQGFTLIVIDEAHRAAADSYGRVLAMCPEARVLGLTATPIRYDNRGLADVFDDLLIGPEPETLIEQGAMARPRVFTVPDAELPDVRGVRRLGGDFNRGEVARRTNKRTLIGSIVREWKERAAGAPTIAFAVSVEHAKSIARRFKRAGVSAECVSGETSAEDRAAALERSRTGTTKVLVNCDLFVEGLDAPWLRCAVLARPTQSLTMHRQQCGRVLRPSAKRPVILDHAGNMRRHGLPATEIKWELAETTSREPGEARVIQCECGALMALGSLVCAECGEARLSARREINEDRRSKLVEIGGQWFESQEAAARHLGIAPNVLRARLRDGKGFDYKRAIDVVVDGVKYPSIAEAVRATGLSAVGIRAEIRRNGRREVVSAAVAARRPASARSVEIDGVSYSSLGAAARILGVSRKMAARRMRKHGAISIDGREFSDIRAAASAMNLPVETLRGRLRRGADPKAPKRWEAKTVKIGRVTYPTIADAARAIGMKPHTLRYRLKNGLPLKAPVSGPQRVSIDGVDYESLSEAARAHHLSVSALRDRISNGRDVTAPKRAGATPTKIAGVEYPSIKAAAEALGISATLLKLRLDRGIDPQRPKGRFVAKPRPPPQPARAAPARGCAAPPR